MNPIELALPTVAVTNAVDMVGYLSTTEQMPIAEKEVFMSSV